jgi:hypothetical protein
VRGKVTQREVVEVIFLMPKGNFKPHPCLVISNNDLLKDEEFFYGLLMTTKNYFPKYTIKVVSDMLTKSTDRESYFATHILSIFNMEAVISKKNTFLKPEYHSTIRNKVSTRLNLVYVIQKSQILDNQTYKVLRTL